jgi:hypothetical protein
MNPQSSFFRRAPALLLIGGLCLLLVSMFGESLFPLSSRHGRFIANTLSSRASWSRLVETYGQAWLSIQAKVDDLRKAEEERSKLRLENANLKLNLEALQFDCHAKKGKNSTQTHGLKLKNETGTPAGKIRASLNYTIPQELLPSQLYVLGVTYFKSREDEKAAAIFTHLTGLDEGDTYRKPKDLLMTGVAWYRLENFKLADQYFDDVLKSPETKESIQYQAQARLWKALVAKRFNKELKSQFWLKELVDHHPHSPEAKWVNSSGEEHAHKFKHE